MTQWIDTTDMTDGYDGLDGGMDTMDWMDRQTFTNVPDKIYYQKMLSINHSDH